MRSRKMILRYDKYAVFRELQMEEELIKAWKTPSDEEKPMEEEGEEEPEPDEAATEVKNDINETATADQESYKNQPICSSEGSPCSRSDTQSPGLKSFSVEDQNYDEEQHNHAVSNATNNSILQNKESKNLYFFFEIIP